MKQLKAIAIYLPQYYETDYNNKWWGKGFTDWTAVKKAVPYFDEHKQPKIPLNEYYYNLLDRSTFEYQAKLMKKYEIYGLCFYHYYFKDGIKVLEKPAENLLKWGDLEIPFCFSWPSENWVRTWSNFYGNIWGEKFDGNTRKNGNGILLEQNFGTRKDWRKHFDYLLPFFRDKRYIKIDDKPVFIFYNAEQVSCIKEMTKYWRELAKRNGLEGIYFIGSNVSGYREELDAIVINEPTNTRKKLLDKDIYTIKNGVTCFKYDDYVNEVLNSKPFFGMKTYFCGVPGYDTTPRRGRNGECFLGNSGELFATLLDGLCKKSIQCGDEFIFINAWNEWGEGMYLEPDKENGYLFLESIQQVIHKYQEIELSDHNRIGDDEYRIIDELKMLNQKVDKFRSLYENAIGMATIIQNCSHSLKAYFKGKKINKISIYGVGPIGKLLINQLIICGIKIDYTVDIYAAGIQENIPMYRPYEKLPQADIMIVTAYGSEKIIEEMKNKGIENVISIEEWMSDLMNLRDGVTAKVQSLPDVTA